MDLSQTKIYSKRLVLTSFVPSDAPDIFAHVTPSLTRFMAFEPSRSPEEFEKIWQEWRPKMERGVELFLVIRDKQTGEFLGVCGAHDITLCTNNPEFNEAEIGLWIKETAHGHGFGREAVLTMALWLKSACSMKHFFYHVAEDNGASRRIPEALGAEVIDKRIHVKPNGQNYLMLIYRFSKIPEEYKALKI